MIGILLGGCASGVAEPTLHYRALTADPVAEPTLFTGSLEPLPFKLEIDGHTRDISTGSVAITDGEVTTRVVRSASGYRIEAYWTAPSCEGIEAEQRLAAPMALTKQIPPDGGEAIFTFGGTCDGVIVLTA